MRSWNSASARGATLQRRRLRALRFALEALQDRQDLPRVPRPLHRVLLQHARDELAQHLRLLHVQRRRGPRPSRASSAVLGEREPAGEHPVEDDAERKHIRALVLRRPAPLFRRHVRRRSAIDLPPAEGVRHAEVEHLHLPVPAQEDVSRGQVPVNHALGMGVREPLRHLDGDVERLRERDGSTLEPARQSLAVKQLEDEIGPAIAASEVEERDDVRVREVGSSLGLAQEPLLANVGVPSRADGLERHVPSELAVAGLPDHSEAAAPDLAEQLEAPYHDARPQQLVPGPAGGHGRTAGQLGEQLRERLRTQTGRRRSSAFLESFRHRSPRLPGSNSSWRPKGALARSVRARSGSRDAANQRASSRGTPRPRPSGAGPDTPARARTKGVRRERHHSPALRFEPLGVHERHQDPHAAAASRRSLRTTSSSFGASGPGDRAVAHERRARVVPESGWTPWGSSAVRRCHGPAPPLRATSHPGGFACPALPSRAIDLR